jgi:subtilisin family serine protease
MLKRNLESDLASPSTADKHEKWIAVTYGPIKLDDDKKNDLKIEKVTQIGDTWIYELVGHKHLAIEAVTTNEDGFELMALNKDLKIHSYRRNGLRIESDVNLICREGDYRGGYIPGFMSWGLDMIDQFQPILEGMLNLDFDNQFCTFRDNDGTGIHIYVVDTGIAPHSTFQDRLTSDFDYYQSGGDWSSYHPHGTHVAGLCASSIYGVAPRSFIHDIRVLDSEGSGNYASLSAGLLWIKRYGKRPGVINLSLGGLDINGVSITSIIKALMDMGFIVVASAGNDNGQDACLTYPGSVENVITVGSIGRSRKRSGFSNQGECVEVYAPGENITSAYGSNQAIQLSGTSMSAPLVTATCALQLQNYPEWDQKMMRKYLLVSGVKDLITDLSKSSINNRLFVSSDKNAFLSLVLSDNFNSNDPISVPDENIMTSISMGTRTSMFIPILYLVFCIYVYMFGFSRA